MAPRWFSLLLAPFLPHALGCTTCVDRSATDITKFDDAAIKTQPSSSSYRDAIELLADGAFRIDGKRFDSCRSYCEALDAYISVASCEGPARKGEPSTIEISCTGTPAICRYKDPISFGHGRYSHGSPRVDLPASVRQYFECMLHGEQAAVLAFCSIRAELQYYLAPSSLISACSRAIADERRHARMFAGVLQRHILPAVSVIGEAAAPRSLDTILSENILEGCFGETLGAMILAMQASRATNLQLRSIASAIWRDEARHADLSMRIAQHFGAQQQAFPETHACLRRLLDSRSEQRYPFEVMDETARAQLGVPSAAEYQRLTARVKSALAQLLTHRGSVAA